MSGIETGLDLEQGLHSVMENIAEAASRSGRDPSDVLLIAVSKGGVSLSDILRLARAGQRHFGENRVQEAWAKYQEFENLPKAAGVGDIVWHFIGRLQRNKVSRVIRFARYIHSVDRLDLAQRIGDEVGKTPGGPCKVMVEVNISGEGVKAGVSVTELPNIVEQVLSMPHLELAGLMTMAPLSFNPESSRAVFRRLFELREELNSRFLPIGTHRGAHSGIHHLSMGMSQDYAVAVEEGATMVRVGRAIFGR